MFAYHWTAPNVLPRAKRLSASARFQLARREPDRERFPLGSDLLSCKHLSAHRDHRFRKPPKENAQVAPILGGTHLPA